MFLSGIPTSTPLKRRRITVSSDIDCQHPAAKKAKHNLVGYGHRPPDYWDTLSKVWLTRGSLAEFDRRHRSRETGRAASSPRPKCSPSIAAVDRKKLKHFARRGGADLTSLRGFSTQSHCSSHKMSRSTGSSRSRHQPSMSGTSGSTTRSSPYSRDFEQKLLDEGILPEGYELSDGRLPSGPENLDEILSALRKPRPSLSPSQFSPVEFNHFKRDNNRALRESNVMSTVIPTIAGRGDRRHHSIGDVPFTHMEKLTSGDVTVPKPDLYYGANSMDIDPRVRDQIGCHILPSTDQSLPAAPNFFLEAKSISGRADVAKRQVCHDGAVGARSMHSLQNYKVPNPVYNEKARTITSTYHDGQLQLYTHHIVPPGSHSDRPEYHMTSLNSFAMTGNIDNCRAGAAAYRNARDWTQKQRDALIAEANTRARNDSPDMMSFTSTDLSRTTSAPNPRHVESDTSPDELALDHEDTTTRRRKIPSSDGPGRHDVSTPRRSIELPVVSDDDSQPSQHRRSRHKSSARHKGDLSLQAPQLSPPVVGIEPHGGSGRHRSASNRPELSTFSSRRAPHHESAARQQDITPTSPYHQTGNASTKSTRDTNVTTKSSPGTVRVRSEAVVHKGRKGLRIEHNGHTRFVPQESWTASPRLGQGAFYCAELDVYTFVRRSFT